MGNRLRAVEKKRPYGLITFGIALLLAAMLIVPFIIYRGGIFWYYGDFNGQEIPFYQLIHSYVRDGNIGWNPLTDLGSDTITSYSFYLIGSPFFWATIPFPNWFVPYLIGPLLIIKIACSALSAYVYLKRYVSHKPNAVLGGLLYAFSGFSVYNIFFFHFHEAMIILPLMLAALDSFLFEKKRGLFALMVFVGAIVNYYFFAGQAVFVLVYFLMLTLTKTWKFSIKEFAFLAVETVTGFAASAIVTVPTVLAIIGNPRVTRVRDGWNGIVYLDVQRYFAIFASFFFPSDVSAYPVFTPDLKSKWASNAAWLPLFGMTGVIAYLQMRKRDWLKKLLVLLFLMSAIPLFNSAFQMFNLTIHYSRWFYMLDLMMILATLKACEAPEDEVDWSRAIVWSAGITAVGILLVGLMPNYGDADDSRKLKLGVMRSIPFGWVYGIIALSCILLLALIYKRYFSRDRKRFFTMALVAVIVISVPISVIPVAFGVTVSSSTVMYRDYVLNARDKIEIDDLEQVRSDIFGSNDNVGMYWKTPFINCFQSTVSNSIMEFYDMVGYYRSVGSRPDFTMYGLRPLLSVKYYFDYTKDNTKADSDKNFLDEEGDTKMPDWKYLKTCNGFDIYENENYIPMGYCFSEFVTEEEFERIEESHRTEALLYAMVLSRGDMKKYADITGYTDEKYSKLYSKDSKKFKSAVDKYSYGSAPYRKACKELASRSCSEFKYVKNGFEATFNNTGDDNLLFFSVPYSKGFSATVNGESAEIVKADKGLMAVRVPGHRESKIVFSYETPGLKAGVAISLCSVFVFAAYLIVAAILKKRERNK